MTVVIGSGQRAARIFFGVDDSTVEIRQGVRIISGNGDLAFALRWILDHPAGDAPTARIGMEDLRMVLHSLQRQGIPPEFWGTVWARLYSEARRTS
jgi:hypothetical protein